MAGLWAKTRTTLEMIKWEHSIFALPFALTAVLLAANGLPEWRLVMQAKVAWIFGCHGGQRGRRRWRLIAG